MDRFLGKGLAFEVIIKFLIFNSAWIISLAIPMAILITVLMAFGRLSSDNEITAFKASGIGIQKLIYPALIFGLVIFLLLTPFNLWILPEMNHNVRKLSKEISRNRPDIEFNEQLLNSLADKIIYVGDRKSSNSFNDIVIFDKAKSNHTTILSEYGYFESLQDGIIINLVNGSIHENLSNNEYSKTYFDKYNIAIPFDKIEFNNNNNLTRQEREMNIHQLIEKIKFYKQKSENLNLKINKNKNKIDSLNNKLTYYKSSNNYNLLMINKVQTQLDNAKNKRIKNEKLIPTYIKKINKYSVELHKKFSLPIACFIFILLGTPLGIISKNKNMSVSISIGIVFFIIYWSFLIVGEDLADRGQFNPALSMWLPNIILGTIAYYLYKKATDSSIRFNVSLFKKRNK
tara:strand:+ start:261 stop:1463 length:1203 start_codon:yes stop_codon:yes gene_type:complete